MFSLMPLPYSRDALSPAISEKTVELHYTKHHQGYVNQLNDLVAQLSAYQELSLEAVVKRAHQEKNMKVFNNGAQIIAHDMYWMSLSPVSEKRMLKEGALRSAVESAFGSVQALLDQWVQQGLAQFGSGWAWLVTDKKGALTLTTTSNAMLPWLESSDIVPLLVLDVWEHAYYVDYYNVRKAYLEQVVHYINWEYAEEAYLRALEG
jgi:Fe-Mn family superoxide dismutase